MSPERWAPCFTEERRVTLRFTRSGGVFVIAVRESTEHEKDAWSALTAASPLELSCVAALREDDLSEEDPYVVYVSLYGDEFNVHKRRRGSLEGYYGGYTSLCLEDRAFSAHPLFDLPPGASPEALLRKIVDDLIRAGKEGLTVYDAFKKDSLMAAKSFNSIDAEGKEHCTSCDIVHKKTVTDRKERAMSSTVSFNVKDTRYSRTQERASLIMSVI